MCCFFLALVLAGPRIAGAFWWLFQPMRWNLAFAGWFGLWWIWPVLGIIFLPWTTLAYVILAPGGLNVFSFLMIGIMLVADITSYASGARRKQLPGYEGI